jgi:hypothetical protein
MTSRSSLNFHIIHILLLFNDAVGRMTLWHVGVSRKGVLGQTVTECWTKVSMDMKYGSCKFLKTRVLLRNLHTFLWRCGFLETNLVWNVFPCQRASNRHSSCLPLEYISDLVEKIHSFIHSFISRVEAGSNTSTVALRDVGGDEKGSLESETIKYDRESQGTRTREWLRCRGPAAIVNDRPVLSSERAPHINKPATAWQ